MAGHVVACFCRARHQQSRTRLDQHAWRDVVDAAQGFFAHADTPGCIADAQGAWRGPGGPAGELPFGVSLEVALKHLCVVPGQQDVRRAGCKNYRAVCRGIQRLEVGQFNIGQSGGQCNVNVAGDLHLLEVRVILDHWQFSPKGLRVGNDIFDSLQFGYIHPRFVGHAQIGVTGAQSLLLVSGDCPADAAFAPVVGSQRQVPVAKHAVQLLQVVQRGAGRGQHIAPVIAEGVLFQVKILAGGWHELPHAGRLCAGHSLWVEGAFNVGQQGQFCRHVAALEFFDNMKKVFAGPLGHAHDVVWPGGVPLLAVRDQFTCEIGHGKAAAYAVPEICGRLQQGNRTGADLGAVNRREGAAWVNGYDGRYRG